MSVRTFSLVVLGAALVGIAAVARPERVHSPAEVEAAFISARVPLAPIDALLPGCGSAWMRYWKRLIQPRRPSMSCVEAIFTARGIPVSVYVFPEASFVAPVVAARNELPYGFVAARSNVLVLGERRHSAVSDALDELK
jgi:hypothetical protein